MSVSPSSPSKRRQQGGQSAQPQPIAPAPPPGSKQSIALAPSAAAPSAGPAPINTDTSNASSTGNAKSPVSPTTGRKRKAADMSTDASAAASGPSTAATETAANSIASQLTDAASQPAQASPPAKKSRTNTPWTPAEERRLKTLRDAGSSWGEIAKEFPNRTEGSVKKHWYKDMHYADFAEDESAALLAAIREYEANKWKEIGKKVGKPAKACEQYAKENFQGKL